VSQKLNAVFVEAIAEVCAGYRGNGRSIACHVGQGLLASFARPKMCRAARAPVRAELSMPRCVDAQHAGYQGEGSWPASPEETKAFLAKELAARRRIQKRDPIVIAAANEPET
jgi:hypothetical protein